MTVQSTRIQPLNDKPVRPGRYVLYWMQQSQRAEYNHALNHAIKTANQLNQPMLVVFGLTENYPEANLRHFTFMFEGLQETQKTLAESGIKMVVRRGEPDEVALKIGRNASVIVCDRGYLRHQRQWRQAVAERAPCQVIQIESDVVVPVGVVSSKAEYAARTIRPKIKRFLDEYLFELQPVTLRNPSTELRVSSIDLSDVHAALEPMKLDRNVPAVSDLFRGGYLQAQKRFRNFLRNRFSRYADNSNQPQTDDISQMSPYLHFGQISPLQLALMVSKLTNGKDESKAAFLEQLIVRRELAINFVNYSPDYDRYTVLPNWAKKTLEEHKKDKRQWLYSRKELEGAKTHDEYWNAAMTEMKMTGFMHNYMRMYWGKKILEWYKSPLAAFKTILILNNKYFLDGRDANSFAGVAWIFGVHDRAWAERPLFGKVRYMAASGLERKCDIRAYVEKVGRLVEDNVNS